MNRALFKNTFEILWVNYLVILFLSFFTCKWGYSWFLMNFHED